MKIQALAASAAVLMLAACQTTDSAVVADSAPTLEPVLEAPAFAVGDTFTYREKDGAMSIEVVSALNADGTTVWTSDDATWTSMHIFGGAVSWDDEGGSGTQTHSGDSMYPLEVGRRINGEYAGSSDTNPGWSGFRACTVPRTVTLTVEAGTFDTFEVICKQGSNRSNPFRTRTFYFAPEVGHNVLELSINRDGEATRNELVDYSAAAAS